MATTIGAKGSDVYTFDGVGDPRLALSILLVRGQSEENIVDGLKKIIYCSNTNIPDYDILLEDAFVLAFMSRNIRGGKGERDIGKIMFKTLYAEKPDIMNNLLDLIPHYGCWNDIFKIWDENWSIVIKTKLTEIIVKQLAQDEDDMENKKSISLLAKWIPRQTRQVHIASHIAHILFPNETNYSSRMKLYRQKIVKLNKYLNTVEINQCSKHWSDIKPSSVPGRAMFRYKNAFLNLKKGDEKEPRYPLDQDRITCAENFRNHMKEVLIGKGKVNAVNTVLPSEIYKNIISNMSACEDEKNINRAQWKMIRDDLKASGKFDKFCALCDFSGSMCGDPKLVSASLGILLSEISVGPGKNKIMTFDSTPQWIQFPDTDDVYEKAKILNESSLGQGLSTDFQKAMELIISDLKINCTPIEEAPTDLIVFTDMEWDAACGSDEISNYTSNIYRHHVKTKPWQTHVEMIRESFKCIGYNMPRIIIWNLRATAGDFHAQADTEGVLMYSGWSPSIFKQLVKDGFKVQTPYDGLRQQLDDSMYDIIRDRI